MQKQSRFSTLSHPLLSFGIQLGIAALLATAIPWTPAAALRIRSVEPANDYEVCADRLLRAGITPNALAAACAEALRPQDLSNCVLRIKLRTPIAAQDALSGCAQVRRPNDLSSCVLDINSSSKNSVATTEVLDYCRRSLLPISFAECVVALNRKIDISATRALDACFDTTAELPRSPYRTFVPLVLPPLPTASPPPLLPSGTSAPTQMTPSPNIPNAPVNP